MEFWSCGIVGSGFDVKMPHRKPDNDDIPFVHRTPHYLHELPIEDEERLGKLFKQLDKDGNGKIDIHDLSEALKEHGVHHHYAEVGVQITVLSGR